MLLQHGNSVHDKTGTDIRAALQVMANRYVAEHPAEPYRYRAFNREGIGRAHDFRYVFDLAKQFPKAEAGQISYAWGMMWSDRSDAEMTWHATAWGPLEVFVNGVSVYRSLPHDERPTVTKECRAILGEGWNNIVLKFTKTRAGFGGRFGTSNTKWVIFNSIVASKERYGQEGWLFSTPSTEIANQAPRLPRAGQSEFDGLLEWYPRSGWTAEEFAFSPLERLYGPGEGRTAFSWTSFRASARENRFYRIKGHCSGKITLLIDGQEIYRTERPGKIDVPVELTYGTHQLILCDTACPSWGTTVIVWTEDRVVPFTSPVDVKGYSGEWLYLGAFEEGQIPPALELADLHRVYEDGRQGTYWRADAPELWVRPYLEAPLFGKWNYPVGVTLYGIVEAGRKLDRPDLTDYAAEHVGQSAAWYRYTKWDYKQYGAPGINQTIAHIDSLDDCGSFGSTMLEVFREEDWLPDAALAHEIGVYMSEVQERLPDGAFYRKHPHGEHTMWADDLYMSVPFLCRYYRLTGDKRYMNDAARQFLLFRKYLFIPETNLMSHVYDFEQDMATMVPWGRGNGWVLFSLSELLTVLPKEHPDYEELLAIFRTLCRGVLNHQSDEGLWRQVLDEPDAYLETSCTAMFIYAFARGVRNGWLNDVYTYADSAIRAWEGLTRLSIDAQGNLYGVCRGSGYSHSSLYYKYDLHTQLNDTHGIGIVMLAGVEMLRLKEWIQSQS